MLSNLLELRWRLVPTRMIELYEKAAECWTEAVAAAAEPLVAKMACEVLLDPFMENVIVRFKQGGSEPLDKAQVDEMTGLIEEWRAKVGEEFGFHMEFVDWEHDLEDWHGVKVAFTRTGPDPLMEKAAVSEALRGMGQAAGLIGSSHTPHLPGLPSPLAGTLGGALLGAGLGYSAGYLGETVLPSHWNDHGHLRRTLAMAGGIAGATPGLGAMAMNRASGLPTNAQGTLGMPSDTTDKYIPDSPTYNPEEPYVPRSAYSELYDKASAALADVELDPMMKEALSQTGYEFLPLPPIPVDQLSQVLWHDPRVSGPLGPQMSAATDGLIQAAYVARREREGDDQGTRLVYPTDVGRIAAGMGSGYLSGVLVGKVLGTLMGMPEETQERLKNVGMWAGAVQNIVPLAFRGA